MTLNPTIRASYVRLALAFLADFSFTAGLIWPENGGTKLKVWHLFGYKTYEKKYE